MLDNILNIEGLEEEAKEIDSFLNITCSDNPEEVIERGNDLAVYISRTGKMLADAKYWKDKALTESIIRELGRQAGCPASVLKQLVDAACKRENYLVNWIERLNKAATHQLDWLRSVLSKAKEELRLSGGMSGKPHIPAPTKKDYSPF